MSSFSCTLHRLEPAGYHVHNLHGRLVGAICVGIKPAYLWRTVRGVGGRGDAVERTALLTGNHLQLGGGKLVNVVGVLEVIDHPAAVVRGVMVPGCVEPRWE